MIQARIINDAKDWGTEFWGRDKQCHHREECHDNDGGPACNEQARRHYERPQKDLLVARCVYASFVHNCRKQGQNQVSDTMKERSVKSRK